MSMVPETEYGLGPLDLEIGADLYPIVGCPLYDGYPLSPESAHKNTCLASLKSKSQDPVVLDSVDTISVVGCGDKLNITSSDREKDRERRVRTKADIVNATAVSAKNSLKAKARITGGNGKRREKAYRCPTPGCTKSYLNPNGLKYHVEKGTCRFEDSTDSEGLTENTRGTSIANTSAPSTSAPTPSSHLVTNEAILGGNKPSHPLPSRITGTTTGGSSPNLLQHSLLSSMPGYTLTRPLNTIPC